MTKLTKHRNLAWGDDLSAVRKEGDGDIATIDKKLLASYLIQLRKIFETDAQVKDTIINNNPAAAAKPDLMKMLAHEIKPDSKDLFEQAVDIILDELDTFREKPPSLYLINNETGMSVLPITDHMIYTPPDYIGDDGKLHKSKPTLNPEVAASLALAIYGKARIERHLKKATDEMSKQAYKHLSGPEQMLEMVKERLNCLGVNIDDDTTECDQTIEFGREQVEGIMQAPNTRFHRAHMFAAILTQKILKLGGRSASYSIGPIENKENSKQKWYIMKVGVH